MRPFSLLIKPASADCNLRCPYCFYLEKSALYPHTGRHRMDTDTLERLIRGYLAVDQPCHTFCWQGGEPTLMGLSFFRQVTALQQRYGRDGAVVANSVQTNATLIDEAMAAHFGRFGFLAGCSLDGPPSLHDRYRITTSGAPTQAVVMRAIKTLQRHGVAVNVLVLVSQANVRRARELYDYLVDAGLFHLQFVPCVEVDASGALRPFAIGGREWGEFLCELYDAWCSDGPRAVSIRQFDAILQKLLGRSPGLCTLEHDCRQYFVVEHNGDVYPCDFFVDPAWRLGNITTRSWQQLVDSRLYRDFGRWKAAWNDRCEVCRVQDLCAGDCLKHRSASRRSPRSLSILCTGWERFLQHSRPGFEQLALEISAQDSEAHARPAERATVRTAVSSDVGRNDPCPCGSGIKYKKCCWR